MTRVLLAALAPGDDVPADEPADALARLARALRDAGLEVVHAGERQAPVGVAAAAVQEDVEVAVLLVPAGHDGRPVADALAGVDAADVAVVAVAPGEASGDVVARVRAVVEVATGEG